MKKTLKVIAIICAVYYTLSAVICAIICVIPKARNWYIGFVTKYAEWIVKLLRSIRNIFGCEDVEEAQPEAE